MPKYENYCACCGQRYETSRRSQRYCSEVCRETMKRMKKHNRQNFVNAPEEPTVANLCPKDCVYIGRISGTTCCDYILITGRPRGCEVEGCDKYENGKGTKRRWGAMPIPGLKKNGRQI